MNLIFHLVVIAEERSGQMFFQLREQVVVTGYQVWTIRRVGDDVPSKLLQESDCLTGDVGANVVLENAYVFAQHSSSPVLNRLSEVFQCLSAFIVIPDEVKDEVQRFLNGMAASWYDMGIQKPPQRL